MKAYLSKWLWAIWLLLLGSVYSQAIESPTFAYDGQVTATFAYGAGANLSLEHDGKPVFCENNMSRRLVSPHTLFGEFDEFLAAEGIANPVPSTLARVIPKPTGPMRLLDGAEYDAARDAANAANKALRQGNPGLQGWDIHEIQPVKFGGSPTDIGNKIPLPSSVHQSEVTPWWNQLQRDISP